jgi:hypothetical protein
MLTNIPNKRQAKIKMDLLSALWELASSQIRGLTLHPEVVLYATSSKNVNI